MREDNIEKPFLGVRNSVNGQVWRERLDARSRNLALAIAQTTDIPEIIGRVLAGRGVDKDQVAGFLDPTIRDLMPDPAKLTGMAQAAERLVVAIRNGERVAIFGDYDVDGAASSALLFRFLRQHSVDAEIYIPDRVFEGYGPNKNAIADLASRSSLIVTVDCGVSSFKALDEAKNLGVDVVVLDHHQAGTELPDATAIVNPNRQDDLSGLNYLCACGVVFMALVACVRSLRQEGFYRANNEPDLLQLLDLVALATVCDVVPLIELNRAFVVKGLMVMHAQRNAGLSALARVARLSGPVEPYHLGFVLGPRINAGGRIGDASLGARLLTCDDADEALELAERLDGLNQERQLHEARMLEEAVAEAEAEIGDGAGPAVIIVESDQWHPGLVGLIASRLKDRFMRPAIAIHFDREGRGTGSARSTGSADIGEAVRAALATKILEKGGGHAMAAGMTVMRGRLAELRAFMEDQLAEAVSIDKELRKLDIDGALTARSATLDLYRLLEKAGPYGAGNPAPVFALPSHQVRNPRIVGSEHVSVRLSAGDGANLSAIAFRCADTAMGRLLLDAPARLHIAGQLNAQFWQGRQTPQMRIVDVSVPDR